MINMSYEFIEMFLKEPKKHLSQGEQIVLNLSLFFRFRKKKNFNKKKLQQNKILKKTI